MPGRLNRVLNVLRKLIDHGKQLVGTVQQRATAPGFAFFAKPFGTADLAAILARITNGLRYAAALEDALCRRAERGQDLIPTPVRMPAAAGPRAPKQAEPPKNKPTSQPQDPRLARLPTEREIAAAIRRRPIGAVIADICRDLGITPGQFDRASWDELCHAIIAYGGNLAGFLISLNKRLFTFSSGDHAIPEDPLWPAGPPQPLAASTHPP